ncbi:DnaJ domain-containing protein [Acinetobacter rathckeae]|uniref:DnaJ domain-containing protein n=1 Tax=Acinetobacter rathckeae TaxID=2605272 RepID=UPI0018A25300|nr:DnaJ domain-containing protein [Acinetobacter rathckeae]MBF7687473.1 DnaJ domain-containing protein [Acinetobacter rathckeae]MBF7694874.1 DnaJ domain-containing protein [Acinetobacter rathckeae]
MIWAVIIIFIAVFFLSLFLSFWKIIVLTVIGSVIGGPIGGVIGFILGLCISQSGKEKARISGTQRNRQNQQYYDGDVTIKWLTPMVHMASYYAKYQGQPWTSQKVNFVKSMFESYCKTEEDYIYLRDTLKQNDHAIQRQIHLILQQQLDYDSKLEVFKLCAQALYLNDLNDQIMQVVLTDLAEKLWLRQQDYQAIINLFKTHHQQDFNGSSYRQQGSSSALNIAYTRLGLSTTATKEEVVKAYRVKIMKCHPDKNPNATAEEKEKLTQQSIELQEAKDLIVRHLERV